MNQGKFDYYDGDGIGFDVYWEANADNQGNTCVEIVKIETMVRTKTVSFTGIEIYHNFEYDLPILMERAKEEYWTQRARMGA